MKKSGSISMVVSVKARPAEVFRALTDAKSIGQWSGHKGRVEAKIGGKFEMFNGWVKGKVLAYQVGKILAYTWHPTDWDKKTKASIVEYKFTGTGVKTKIRLTHSGFPDAKAMKEHEEGWKEFVFDHLKKYFDAH